MNNTLILASSSTTRIQLLKNAGVNFIAKKSGLNERALEKVLLNKIPKEICLILAEEKAKKLNKQLNKNKKESFIIGCDQVLECEGNLLHKVQSIEEAKDKLLYLRGKTHALHSAVILLKDNEIVWQYIDTALLTMRFFSDNYINNYLENIAPENLQTVGCYQLEGAGINLFAKIEGDFFTILGLPLLPLLQKLRENELLES